jgi:hypothetical protein
MSVGAQHWAPHVWPCGRCGCCGCVGRTPNRVS